MATRRVSADPAPEATVLGLLSRKPRCARPWQEDRALAARDGGERFVEWFDSTAVDSVDGWEHIGVVPLSRVYEVADEARRRAAFWLGFAETLLVPAYYGGRFAARRMVLQLRQAAATP